MASFAELLTPLRRHGILQQNKADISSSRGSSVSTAAASDECSVTSNCSSRTDLMESTSLTGLAAENRRRAALLRERLAEREPAAATAVREQEVQDHIAENELKLAELRQKIFDRPSLATLQPAPQIEKSVADLISANDLKTAELRYLMASRRLQTLVDTGAAQLSQ